MDVQNTKIPSTTIRVNGVTYQTDEAGILRDLPAEAANRLLSSADGSWRALVERKPVVVAAIPISEPVAAVEEKEEEVVEHKKPKGKRS